MEVEIKMLIEFNVLHRFAKRKLDEYVFLGNRLQVSYAPQFESLADTKEKLESRRREVLARLNRMSTVEVLLYVLLVDIVFFVCRSSC